MAPALQLLTSELPLAFSGNAYTTRVQSLGGTAPYVYAAAGLPASLTINSATGVISGTPTAADVGQLPVAITLTDLGGTFVTKSITLEVRPANFRRTQAVVLDPQLESVVQDLAVPQASRERVTGHFARNPEGPLTNGSYAEDQFVHWSSQIRMGSPEVPTEDTLDTQLAAMTGATQFIAEPTLVDITAVTPVAPSAVLKTVFDTGINSGLLHGNEVVLANRDAGPVLDPGDALVGYPAFAQKLRFSSPLLVSGLTLFMSREVDDHSGNVVVTLSQGGPTEVQVAAGSVSNQYGDGTQILASALIPVSSVAVGVRTGWSAVHAIAVTLIPTGPPLNLTPGADYYLTISSDYESPGAHYLRVAASTLATATLQPGVPPMAVTATAGAPNNGPGTEAGILMSPLPGSSTIAWAVGMELVAQVSATTGTVDIQVADTTSLGTNDRYWAGGDAGQQVRLVTGFDDPYGTPTLNPTRLDQLRDVTGEPILITAVKDLSGTVVSLVNGNVDAQGFVSTEGLRLELSAVPTTPFKVLLGARRRLTDMAADALLRATFGERPDVTAAREARVAANNTTVVLADNVLLKSADGTRWSLTVDNLGAVTAAPQ